MFLLEIWGHQKIDKNCINKNNLKLLWFEKNYTKLTMKIITIMETLKMIKMMKNFRRKIIIEILSKLINLWKNIINNKIII